MNDQGNMMNQQQQLMMSMSQPLPIMNAHPPPQQQLQQPPRQMMNRSYGLWQPPQAPIDQLKFPSNSNPNPNSMMKAQGFGPGKQQKILGPRNNWKGKKASKMDKRMDGSRRMEKLLIAGSSTGGLGVSGGSGYQPPTLKELQHQNRVKARRFFPKKKFYHNNMGNMNAPFAPRNTTSFLIRAKKSGGIASLVSPCPVTPAVLPTPMFSPSREVLVDMAKEEWGVDGYGSMKGLIRLRSPGNEAEGHEDEDEEEGGSSESDVEEHVEVERRLDHDLSRFEMIYPSSNGIEYNNILENRVDDQDTHIAQLEEENLILKERLFLMERELGDLRRRLHCLERQSHGDDELNEEVIESESENETDSHGEEHCIDQNNEGLEEEENTEGGDCLKSPRVVSNDEDVKPALNEECNNRGKGETNPAAAEAGKRTDTIADVERLGTENIKEAGEKDEKKQEETEIEEDNIHANVDVPDILTSGDVQMENAADREDGATLKSSSIKESGE